MMIRLRPSRDLSGALIRNRQSGLTLIELIVSVVLLAILAAAGAGMFYDSFTTTRMVNASQDSASQARYALERMEREIREVGYSGTAFTIGTRALTSFVFTKGDGVTVTIANSGTNLTLGYSTLVAPSTLSNQVSNFALTYYRIDPADGSIISTGVDNGNLRFVEISLTLTDTGTSGQSIAQRTRVALRNAP